MPKVVVACGTGIATSTHIASKIKSELEKNNIKINITQCRISELESIVEEGDIVVTTSAVPPNVKVKVFNGIPFLTGISEDALMKDILTEIGKIVKKE